MKQFGLVLSGGGARGLAHLGAMQALCDIGLRPSIISGVSAGAIAGIFYASGYEPKAIFDTIIKAKVYKFLRPALINRQGLMKLDRTTILFKKLLPETFEELKLPVIISATELGEGKTIFFETGKLVNPLQASFCIPIMFEPIIIDGLHFVDGGLLNNLPYEPIREKYPDMPILGIHVNPKNDNFTEFSMKKIAERSFNLALSHNVKERKKECTFLLEPQKMKNFGLFQLSKADEMYQIGYNEVMQNKEKLLEFFA